MFVSNINYAIDKQGDYHSNKDQTTGYYYDSIEKTHIHYRFDNKTNKFVETTRLKDGDRKSILQKTEVYWDSINKNYGNEKKIEKSIEKKKKSIEEEKYLREVYEMASMQ